MVAAGGDHRRRCRSIRSESRTTTKESVVQFLTFDTENPNSILSCLRAARENARGVREIISAEMWEHINKFYLIDPRRRLARRSAR